MSEKNAASEQKSFWVKGSNLWSWHCAQPMVAPKNAPEPRGVTVLPGEYKVVMYYGKAKDSTMVNVAYDPRVEMPQNILKNKYDLLKQLEIAIQGSYDALIPNAFRGF